MEVIPAAADHPARRMLVARLYNAEVKVSALAEFFDLDHKTIRAWGLALDGGQFETLGSGSQATVQVASPWRSSCQEPGPRLAVAAAVWAWTWAS
jgi:hypothetical protein